MKSHFMIKLLELIGQRQGQLPVAERAVLVDVVEEVVKAGAAHQRQAAVEAVAEAGDEAGGERGEGLLWDLGGVEGAAHEEEGDAATDEGSEVAVEERPLGEERATE